MESWAGGALLDSMKSGSFNSLCFVKDEHLKAGWLREAHSVGRALLDAAAEVASNNDEISHTL